MVKNKTIVIAEVFQEVCQETDSYIVICNDKMRRNGWVKVYLQLKLVLLLIPIMVISACLCWVSLPHLLVCLGGTYSSVVGSVY